MRPHLTRAITVTLILALYLGAASSSVVAAGSTTQPIKRKTSYPLFVRNEAGLILNTLQQNQDYDSAIGSLQLLFDQAVFYAPEDQVECIRQTDAALRLVKQLKPLEEPVRMELLPYLRKHPQLTDTLVFLMRPNQKQPVRVYRMLDKLHKQLGNQLDDYATLASALCVVQQTPLTRQMNENAVQSSNPVELFDYYVKNQSRMFFGIKNVPAELLVYVVDTTASPDEMQWALNKYAGNPDVGSLFFSINYDYAYLKRGTDKTVTVKGYNLPNILKFGGVCIDQAYFATSVGKAIGVPTALDTGESAGGAHAWAGYLQFTGRSAVWNFDSGRYDDFQDVRGSVLDPQTREEIPDSYVSLLGEMIGTRPVDRQNAVALTDAADRLIAISQSESSPPSPVTSVTQSSMLIKPRHADVATALSLLELGLKQSIACAPAWFTVRDLAKDGKLTDAEKQEWSDVLLRLGAKKYPYFTIDMLMPMVLSIDNAQEQNELLDRMLPLFSNHADLSARILMTQAKLWESKNQSDRAGQCYLEIISRYANSGPFVMPALKGAGKLLDEEGRGDKVPDLYAQAWSQTGKPDGFAKEFLEETNWYQIGKAYVELLKKAGQDAKATEVESKLAS